MATPGTLPLRGAENVTNEHSVAPRAVESWASDRRIVWGVGFSSAKLLRGRVCVVAAVEDREGGVGCSEAVGQCRRGTAPSPAGTGGESGKGAGLRGQRWVRACTGGWGRAQQSWASSRVLLGWAWEDFSAKGGGNPSLLSRCSASASSPATLRGFSHLFLLQIPTGCWGVGSLPAPLGAEIPGS